MDTEEPNSTNSTLLANQTDSDSDSPAIMPSPIRTWTFRSLKSRQLEHKFYKYFHLQEIATGQCMWCRHEAHCPTVWSHWTATHNNRTANRLGPSKQFERVTLCNLCCYNFWIGKEAPMRPNNVDRCAAHLSIFLPKKLLNVETVVRVIAEYSASRISPTR